MKNLVVLLFVFVFGIYSCTNLKFVHKSYDESNIPKNQIKFTVYGKDRDIIINYLKKNIGDPDNKHKFLLTINSSKNSKALVIDKDATASKIEVEYVMSYNLINIQENCIISNQTLSTKSSYNTKSSGYSFGTDIAETELSVKNIELNVERFLNTLSQRENGFDC